MNTLNDLADQWREEAETLRRRGAVHQAETLESAAEELEERLREWKLEALTLEKAAEEAGLAYDTVQRKVANGELPNAGEKGSPRVRRCHLLPALKAPEPQIVEEPVEELADEVLGAAS